MLIRHRGSIERERERDQLVEDRCLLRCWLGEFEERVIPTGRMWALVVVEGRKSGTACIQPVIARVEVTHADSAAVCNGSWTGGSECALYVARGRGEECLVDCTADQDDGGARCGTRNADRSGPAGLGLGADRL